MRIREEIVKKYWHDAAVDELSVRYATQGYKVHKNGRIGNHSADLIAKKGKELIVFAVDSGDWRKERIDQVQQIRREVVHQLGGKFSLVLATPPVEQAIEVEEIEEILLQELIEDPRELNELSTHTSVEEVADVTVALIRAEKNRIHVEGSGLVFVQLIWGSTSDTENDDGLEMPDSFPFTFKISLDGNLKLIEAETLIVDVSSFYEE